MPSAARKRSKIQIQEDESEEERPTQGTQRRRRVASDDEEDEDDAEEEGGEGMDLDNDADSQDQLVKKLVRYALACEYQRIPIRRAAISENVIGKNRGAFKRTFEKAQNQLQTKFGMQLIELPIKEKVTMRERRAQKPGTTSKSSASYMLCSTLPTEYRTAEIMPPSMVGDEAEEAAYVGLYTFIITIIALSPDGTISDDRLNSHLRRMNADTNMPMDKTEIVLAKMARQNYIFKTVERNEHEETIEWRVGPRGKVEIGDKGIKGLVTEVFGDEAPADLDKKLDRSLGIQFTHGGGEEEEEEEEEQPREVSPIRRQPGRRR